MWIIPTVLAGVLLLWLLFVVIGSMLRKRKGGKKETQKAPKPAAPTAKTHDAGHHPKGDGHGAHGNDGHHGHGLPMPVKALITLACLTLMVGIAYALLIPLVDSGFFRTPGQIIQERLARQQVVGAFPGAAYASVPPAPAIELDVRKPLIAPVGDTWSEWLRVPSGYNILSCEADDALDCTDTETDSSKVRYAYQCKDNLGNVHDFVQGTCETYIALRVRSKTGEPLSLAWWYVNYG